MSSLPPSQAFLNTPDDFIRRVPTPERESHTSVIAASKAKHREETLDDGIPEESLDPGPSSNKSGPSNNTVKGKQAGDESYLELNKAETQQDATAPKATVIGEEGYGMDYEMHYEISQRSVKDVVKEILDDIATHKNLHDWDHKLVITPFRKLEAVIRSHLATCSQEMLNNLLIHSSVEEVLSTDEHSQSNPAMQHNGQANGHFFFTQAGAEEVTLTGKDAENLYRGRIICINDCESHNERAVLLWVYSLCIRLENEDKAYIRNFIERHLNLKSTIVTPYHWQPTSPPEIGEQQHQKHYRRVSLSFHLTYLTMSAAEGSTERQSELDRTSLFPWDHGPPGQGIKTQRLCKASTSTLMTLVIPKESRTREEELQLLTSPKGLWTVLMVNYPRRTFDEEQQRYLTPNSQFIRGITAALVTQRSNAESIYEFLRRELQACDSGGLFDDEHFSKSNTYHRTIQVCSELKDSFDSTFRFMKKIIDGQLKELRNVVHQKEKPGVEYWMHGLHDELFALKEVRAQVAGLSERAEERRAALHGATAILEARTALQQGQRLKVLAYLATLYLPLTATSSIYSMSVLPNSASLASSFVVFSILLLLTLLPSIYRPLLNRLPSIAATTFKVFTQIKPSVPTQLSQASESSTSLEEAIPETSINPLTVTPPTGPRKEMTRLERYLQGLTPQVHPNAPLPSYTSFHQFKNRFPCPDSLYYLLKFLLWEIPAAIAFSYLWSELFFPIDQYSLYKRRKSEFMKSAGWIWHPLAFVRDIFRALLLPIWVVVIVVLTAWLIALSLVWGVLYFLIYILVACVGYFFRLLGLKGFE